MTLNLKSIIMAMVMGSLFLLACGFLFPYDGSPRGMKPDSGTGGTNYKSNGERIYFTAINEQGEYIQYTDGPAYGGMMSANLACVSCHGPDGRGGRHMMHMEWMDAPDIRYSTLAAEEGEHATEEHETEYDLEDFRQAVVLGQHPDGEALSKDMPRWQLNDEDLDDLLEFLKTLP